MQTLPTKSSAVSLPAPLAPQIERDLKFVVGKLDPMLHPGFSGYTLAECDAPSSDLRRSLEVRRQRIDDWMLPAGPERATEEYLMLNRVMAHKDHGEKGAREHVAIFVKDTMGLPMFALVGACQAFRTGQIGDGQWMPEPGLVCAEARKRMAALAKERREIDAVLTARIAKPNTSPARKAMLLDVGKGLLKSIPLAGRSAERVRSGQVIADDIPPEKTESQHLAHAKALAAEPLPKLSDELRRKYVVATAADPKRDEAAA